MATLAGASPRALTISATCLLIVMQQSLHGLSSDAIFCRRRRWHQSAHMLRQKSAHIPPRYSGIEFPAGTEPTEIDQPFFQGSNVVDFLAKREPPLNVYSRIVTEQEPNPTRG